MRVALTVITLITTTASVLFFIQGGFGAGHGDFDMVLFVLGLPRTFLPWPAFITKHDFVWVIGLPFMLNVAAMFMIVTSAKWIGRNSKPLLL